MHLYAFGSICRGEISFDSDVDLLAIINQSDASIDPNMFSIYSYKGIMSLWEEGNPFAWHLFLESRLLFASDENNFIETLGEPKPYRRGKDDCIKFQSIFNDARTSLTDSNTSAILDLSTIFLSIRNIATCFSLGTSKRADFSRNSALNIDPSLKIDSEAYKIYERSRILCTRAIGTALAPEEIAKAKKYFDEIENWMTTLVRRINE